jgi:hypothetical protein
MANTQFLPDEAGETKRPDLIASLGILSFINTGFFILVYGIGLLGMLAVSQLPLEEFMALVEESMSLYMPDGKIEEVEGLVRILHTSGVSLMLIYLLRTVARLIGAIGIWQGRKSGFHLYASAQMLGLFLPHIILPLGMLGLFGPLMTVAITALYSSQYRRLG